MKFNRFVSLFLCLVLMLGTLLPAAVSAEVDTVRNASQIPGDAAEYNGHYYKIYTKPTSWKKARKACEKLGGHLVTINSSGEGSFILSLMKQVKAKKGNSYWIGLTDEKKEGDWKQWITGEPVTYTKWSTGNPDDLDGQDYVRIMWKGYKKDNGWKIYAGEWDDVPGEYPDNSGYICEWEGGKPEEPKVTEKPEVPEETLYITGSKYVAVKKTIKLQANLPVIWQSSDETIATVSQDGKVQGIKAGKVKIYAILKDNQEIRAGITVTVLKKAVSKITVKDKSKRSVKEIGDTNKLEVSVSPKEAAQDVVWSSSDPSIATVDSKGNVTAVSGGVVTITATAVDGSGKSGSCKVLVFSEKAYYNLLRTSSRKNLLEDEDIYAMAKYIIERNCEFQNFADRILSEVRKCNVDVFRDLFLWSLLEYKIIQGEKTAYGTEENNAFVKLATADEDKETLFHEIGHAVDGSLKKQFYSGKEEAWKFDLYHKLQAPIIDIVNEEVVKAAKDNHIDENASVLSKIINEIIGPDNEGRAEQKIEGRDTYLVIPLPSSIQKKYEKLWTDCLIRIANRMSLSYGKAYVLGGGDSEMLRDMMSGMTNNTVYSFGGHGLAYNSDQNEYWFKKDGKPTYMQNVEAWAEYYSSVITGTNRNSNESTFSDACALMKKMALKLLDEYKAKHK